MITIIRQAVEDFCTSFVESPYLSYTEHGQHALLLHRLLEAIPKERRYMCWNRQKVCVVQKEYPTACKLGKPQRQHWDIAILKSPPTSKHIGADSYDYLELEAVVEFGMNETIEHLRNDIERVSHPNSNAAFGFIIHLYRLSTPGAQFSSRDWSPNSTRIVSMNTIPRLVDGKCVDVYYGMADLTGKFERGLWRIDGSGETTQLV